MALPSEYKQVEYIESSGTQYINTGYIPSNNTKVECEIWWWNTWTWQYWTMFWTRLEWSSSWRWFMLDYYSTNSYVLYMFWWWYNPRVWFSFPSWWKHTIEFSLWWVYEDWTLKFTPSSATFTSPVNLYISALNDNWTAKEFWWFKLYSCKIWNSWTLVRDFVPAIRKSDKKPWLYDLVNNSFYTNAWTWEFEYPARYWKITHIYLGTNLIRPSTPSTFEYSYDFRNKSWSTVQSDWWTLAQWTSWTTINSNGINCPTRWQWDSNRVWINRAIDSVWNAKKVTITKQVYVQADSWWNLSYYKLAAANTPIGITPSMQIAYSWTTASWYQWHTWQLWLPNSETISSPTVISTWTWLCKWEVDLVNKTSKLTVNWTVIKTWTVSDSTVSAIRDWAYIHVIWWHDTWTIYIQTVSIKVEY